MCIRDRPQVEDATENITVISVVGRYLEHSRIYRFGVGDDEKIYIASADFMTRNTVRRVEVATPVYDAHAKDKIRHIFDTIMTDDEKGKELCADGEYVDRKINSTPVDSQEQFFEEAYKNILEVKGLWIEDMLDRGMPINEPNIKPRFSGRFVVRVPKTLHRLLAEESEREGISLNQFVNNSLAFVVGQKLAH